MANRVGISMDFHLVNRLGCEDYLCSRDWYDGTLWFLIATYWKDGIKHFVRYNQKHITEVLSGTQVSVIFGTLARHKEVK